MANNFTLQDGSGLLSLQDGSGLFTLQSASSDVIANASFAGITASASNVSAVLNLNASFNGISAVAPTATAVTVNTVIANASFANLEASSIAATVTITSTSTFGDTLASNPEVSAGPSASTSFNAINASGATAISIITSNVIVNAVELTAPNAHAQSDVVAVTNVYPIDASICKVPDALTIDQYADFNFQSVISPALGESGVAVGNYLYVTLSDQNRLYVIDATDKAALSVVTTKTVSNSPTRIVTDGSFLYILHFSPPHILQKWDISTPTNPVLVASSVALGGGSNRSVSIDSGYLYVTNNTLNQFLILDTATLSIQSTTSTDIEPFDFAFNGNIAYLSCNAPSITVLQIFDVTNKSSPSFIGSVSYTSGGRDIDYYDNHIYTANNANDIVVINVSAPSSPVVIFSNASSTEVRTSSTIVDGNFFTAITRNGIFYWYDITNPTLPVLSGSIPYGSSNKTSDDFYTEPYFYVLSSSITSGRSVRPLLFGISTAFGVAADISSAGLLSGITATAPTATGSADSVTAFTSFAQLVVSNPAASAIIEYPIHKTVIRQYEESPTINAVVNNYAQTIDARYLFDSFYNNIWNIDTANSQGLDIWGRIVGVSRYLTLQNSDYFGFDPDFQPFDNAPFFGGATINDQYRLSNDDFRRVIKAKALANITGTTIPGIELVLQQLFSVRGKTKIRVAGFKELDYVFKFVPTDLDNAIITAPNLLPIPAGHTINKLFEP